MKSIRLQKRPPKDELNIEYNGFRYYIQNYGLAVDKLARACNTDETEFYDEFRQHIAKIIDPLAFEGGYTQLVKDIEAELNMIDEPGTWDGNKFLIKTIINSTGSTKGIIRRQTNAELITLAGVGSNSGILPDDSTTIPIESEREDTEKLNKWSQDFKPKYADPEEGDVFEMGIKPSDSGRFQFHFNVDNDY